MSDEEALQVFRRGYDQAVAKDPVLGALTYIRGMFQNGMFRLVRQNERTHEFESAYIVSGFSPLSLEGHRFTDPFYKLCVAVQRELVELLRG